MKTRGRGWSSDPQRSSVALEQQIKKKAGEIVAQAENKAEELLRDGRIQADQLLAEIRQGAQREASGILEKAREEARAIRESARAAAEPHTKTAETPGPKPRTGEYPFNPAQSDAIVIQCSDARFQEAFRQFTERGLGFERYYPIVIPGASQLLTFADSLPKFASGLLRPLKFLAKNGHITRVAVIMHEDCQWYKGFVPQFMSLRRPVKDQQLQDLLTTRKTLREEFPELQVDLYYAAIAPDNQVTFTKVEEAKEKR